MGFYIDLTAISIDQFKRMLKSMDLFPSWKMLEENIDAYFDSIKDQGIINMDGLIFALKTKEKIKQFSEVSSIPENYLTVLNRVAKGYRQKSVMLKDFVWLDQSNIKNLENLGIKDTLKLYDKILTRINRIALSKEAGIDQSDLVTLAKLADLTRIRWVNHTFAWVLLSAGYDTTEKVAEADHLEMHETIKRLNEEKKIYNAHIGINDMKMVIDGANLLDFEIEL